MPIRQLIILLLIIYNFSNSKLFGINSSTFNDIQKNYISKEYGYVINKSMLLLNKSFQNLLKDTIPALPYIKQAQQTNANYSLDMTDKYFNYNLNIDYSFYFNKVLLKVCFVYAFEESLFYQTYIQNYSDIPESGDLSVLSLNNIENKFLWNSQESIAYFIHSFPINKLSQEKSSIPGLLLKIKFSDPSLNNQQIQELVEQIISQTKWNMLEKLYIN